MVSAQSRLTASRGLVVDGAAAIDAGRFTEYRTARELSEDEDEVEDEDEGKGLVSMAETFSVISANLGRCSKDTLESRNLKCLDEEPQAEEALVSSQAISWSFLHG